MCLACTYDSGGKVKLQKALQDERLIQFFIGLNNSYGPVKSNILMISPLPSVNQAYAHLM